MQDAARCASLMTALAAVTSSSSLNIWFSSTEALAANAASSQDNLMPRPLAAPMRPNLMIACFNAANATCRERSGTCDGEEGEECCVGDCGSILSSISGENRRALSSLLVCGGGYGAAICWLLASLDVELLPTRPPENRILCGVSPRKPWEFPSRE